jgi:hypothetical protein
MEQLSLGSAALTGLADDWRHLLFPDADNEQFADGYAQAVTFGLPMARAQDVPLANGLDRVARALARTSTVIGSAFRVLTDDVDSQDALKVSLGTLVRVLSVVDWATATQSGAATQRSTGHAHRISHRDKPRLMREIASLRSQ